jgi:hypothetical protein
MEMLYQQGVPHAGFLQELSRAFAAFTNLELFIWLCPENASLPILLKYLSNFHRLRDVRIHGHHLNMAQAMLLTDIKAPSALTLEKPSTSLLYVLFDWVDRLGESLTSLTLKVRVFRLPQQINDALNGLEIARFGHTSPRDSPPKTP